MAWKPVILSYTEKKNGKVGVRAYSGVSAGDALSSGCAYIFRSDEAVCCGHLHAEPGEEYVRIPKRECDDTYLATVRNKWKSIVESETGLAPKDWEGSGWARSDATCAYAYILPLPNDTFDNAPGETRQRIETLLASIYGHDSTDISYALHKGESAQHEQNTHLHIYIRPRNQSGKKWRMNRGELLQWHEEKRRRFGDVLSGWGYEVEHVANGNGNKRRTRGAHGVFLRKGEDGVVSESVRRFGTALKAKNEGSRTSRWHAACALRWSAYQAVVKGTSWAEALREQGWELCRAEGPRQTWQIRDTESGKAFALRRLFSCREAEVDSHIMEMRKAIEEGQATLAKIRRERPEEYHRAMASGPTLGKLLGSSLARGVQQEPGGAIALLLLCPGIVFLVTALIVALRGLEKAHATADEATLKTELASSWREEKSLRQEVKERLSSFASERPSADPAREQKPKAEPKQEQKPQPTQEIRVQVDVRIQPQPQEQKTRRRFFGQGVARRVFGQGQRSLSEAIKAGDLKTAGKLDKDRDGIADVLEKPKIVDADGNGVDDTVDYKKSVEKFHAKQTSVDVRREIVAFWDDRKRVAIEERGLKDSGILDYRVTSALLKKGSA